jgi:hypothetical protein
MGSFHEGMRNWIEKPGEMICPLDECDWAYVASGIDTKGDVFDAYSRHLKRHDQELSRELDNL